MVKVMPTGDFLVDDIAWCKRCDFGGTKHQFKMKLTNAAFVTSKGLFAVLYRLVCPKCGENGLKVFYETMSGNTY